jgi:Immunity protein 74
MSLIKSFFAALGGRRTKIDSTRRLIRLSRDEYRYCDGERCLRLQIDMLKGQPDRLIYSSTIKQWLPPHDSLEIPDSERRQIAETIRRFLERCGHAPEVR